MILTGLAILVLIAIVAIIYYRQKETFDNKGGAVVGKFAEPIPSNPTQNFALEPVNLTFMFADPVGDTATSFDRVLSRFTDKTAPTSLVKGAEFPEAAPYSDSEVEAISKKALSRVKGPDAPILNFVSVEYAAKGVDNLKNAHYDISFVVYDAVKAYALKLSLVAILAPNGRLWIKKFESFNGASAPKDDNAPKGVMNVDDIELSPFVTDFVSFEQLYKDN